MKSPPKPTAKLTKKDRLETIEEWRRRLGEDRWKELLAHQDAHSWHPHQLRHTAGTHFRSEFGLEVAQVLLGHRHAKTTEIYAAAHDAAATKAMECIG